MAPPGTGAPGKARLPRANRWRLAPGVARIHLWFIVASVPAALAGAIGAGANRLAGDGQAMLAGISIPFVADALASGLGLLLPLLLACAATAAAWEMLFMRSRQRAFDSGCCMATWFYVLLLPPQTPVALAVIGLSFGLVFGFHAFGGTGRYIASPAIVGALFVHFSYPALSAATGWSTLAAASSAVADAWPLLLGLEAGLLGTTSDVAILAGAAVLLAAGLASPRTLLGAAAAFAAAAALATSFGSISPLAHGLAGNAAFCWAFLLTDPATGPLTRAGRWLHGAAFAGLLVLMREANPEHPESSLFALLLAGLMVPAIDALAISACSWRYRATLVLR